MSNNNGPDWGDLGLWLFLSVSMVCGTIMSVWGGK